MDEPVRIKVRNVDGGVDGAPPWITTFVDMCSLLVTFFILLFTFSSVYSDDRFTFPKNIIASSGIWDTSDGTDMIAPEDDLMQAFDLERGGRTPHSRSPEHLTEGLEEMGQRLTDEHVALDANHVGDGLRMRFGERAAFAPGSAIVNQVLATALGELGRTMQHYPHTVVIEGFPDPGFAPTPAYPSAETLALARARAAAQVVLARSGLAPERVQIAAGRTAQKDPASASALERRAERRVEVRILAMDRARAKKLEEEARR